MPNGTAKADEAVYGTTAPTHLKDGREAVLEPPPGQTNRFWPGRPRSPGAGIPRGAKNHRTALFEACRRISEETGVDCNPGVALLNIISGRDEALERHAERLGIEIKYEADQKSWIDLKGNIHLKGLVNFETRVDCIKALMPYFFPRLSSVAITDGEGNGLLDVRSRAMESAQKDPALRAAMETIQMKVSEAVANAKVEEDRKETD